MAATAVYASINGDNPNLATVLFSNISATTAGFRLAAGNYGIKVKGSTFGTVTLQIQLDDATTWVTADTAFSADGFHANVNLPSGLYRFAVA
jgi:hypothetical protein